MPFVTCDALGGALSVSSVQADIRTGSNKCAHNRKIAPFCCNGEWHIENVVITVNIRVSLRAEQCLHNSRMTTSYGIHECCVSLRRLNLQVSLVLNKLLNSLAVSLHGRIH